MKTLIASAIFALSFSAAAQVVNVYPQVINFGHQAQVQVYNNTEDNVHCSGFVYLNTQLGRTESHYYSEYIYKKRTSFRYFYLTNFADRINFAHHSIYCRKVQ